MKTYLLLLNGTGIVSQKDLDNSRLRKAEEYTRNMIEGDLNGEIGLTYLVNAVEVNDLEMLDRLYEKAENDITHVSPEGRRQGGAFKFLEENFDVLEDDEVWEKKYKLQASTNDIELLRQRVEQHESQNYDDTELISYLQVAESPETQTIRQDDFFPSIETFKRRFWELDNARWRAGMELEDEEPDGRSDYNNSSETLEPLDIEQEISSEPPEASTASSDHEADPKEYKL